MAMFMHTAGKKADIVFTAANPCRKINTINLYNLILVQKGSLTLEIEGESVKANAPSILTLKENLAVKFVTSSRDFSAQSVHFDVTFLYRSVSFETVNSGKYEQLMWELQLIPLNAFYDRASGAPYVFPLSERELASAKSFLMHVEEAMSDRTYERWSCRTRQSLNGLLELLHQVYLDFLDSAKQNDEDQHPHAWVQDLLKIIHANYANDTKLSLSLLAREIGINKDTVSKKFKEVVGCSVGNYIIDYRIKCAAYLLGSTECNVKEIATKCGFSNEAYFSRQFNKRKGMTPTQYRINALKTRRAAFSPDVEQTRTGKLDDSPSLLSI